ncbi:hypothetical protein DASC09_033210 [Saccharomycopsis crataegensis]|uniref:MARVEL domain-containing protein n=1 Tax=Saccharomycopsis crataegensis TaxID=43959 RepID=A0AAV5QMR8_9ASCO|nr:hypothetical protein DASC09_033210 [Saccharomycopsis crataegensis]
MNENIFSLLNSPSGSPKKRASHSHDPIPINNNFANSSSAPYSTLPPPTIGVNSYSTAIDNINDASQLATQHINKAAYSSPVQNTAKTPTPKPVDPYNVYPSEATIPQAQMMSPTHQQINSSYHHHPQLLPSNDIMRSNTVRSRIATAKLNYEDPQNMNIREDVRSTNSRRYFEEQLYSQVLTRPLFITPVPIQEIFGIGPTAFSVNTLMHLFEIVFAVATIVLCSNSINNDTSSVKSSVWGFLIASSGILLGISVLFLFRIMNFEHNNGIFYCLTGSGLSLSAMGVAIGVLLPTPCEEGEGEQCKLRRAETALICVGAILWLINLIQFITVYYISRLELARTLPAPAPEEEQDSGNPYYPSHQSMVPDAGFTTEKNPGFYAKRHSDPATLIPTSTTSKIENQQLPPPIDEPVHHRNNSLKYSLGDDGLHILTEDQARQLQRVALYSGNGFMSHAQSNV